MSPSASMIARPLLSSLSVASRSRCLLAARLSAPQAPRLSSRLLASIYNARTMYTTTSSPAHGALAKSVTHDHEEVRAFFSSLDISPTITSSMI